MSSSDSGSSSCSSSRMPAVIQSLVAEYLELSAGVFATPVVLSRMLAIVQDAKRLCMLADDMPAFGLPHRTIVQWEGRSKNSARLRVQVMEALRTDDDYVTKHDAVFEKFYPATSDGLLAGMVDAKEALVNLKRGFCEPCLALTPSQRKLKGKGFAVCGGCAVSAAFGCKRVY
jgi:hypothetical protein